VIENKEHKESFKNESGKDERLDLNPAPTADILATTYPKNKTKKQIPPASSAAAAVQDIKN